MIDYSYGTSEEDGEEDPGQTSDPDEVIEEGGNDGGGENPKLQPTVNPAAADTDNDGILDDNDNCIDVSNSEQTDIDGDGLGDACDDDKDGDGVNNDEDNCPLVANVDQLDLDGNDVGDICDGDDDGDGVDDVDDNCPETANADQKDDDADGTGNVCDGDYIPEDAISSYEVFAQYILPNIWDGNVHDYSCPDGGDVDITWNGLVADVIFDECKVIHSGKNFIYTGTDISFVMATETGNANISKFGLCEDLVVVDFSADIGFGVGTGKCAGKVNGTCSGEVLVCEFQFDDAGKCHCLR